MRIEEYILRELLANDDSHDILNKKSDLEKEYWVGYCDAFDVVKNAIMKHYNDNLAGEDEVTRFCIENQCSKCDTCEHSYYVYGCEQGCMEKYQNNCLENHRYAEYTQTKPLRNKAKLGC